MIILKNAIVKNVQEWREQIPVENLTSAASMSQRGFGNKDAAKTVKYITVSPARTTKVRKENQKEGSSMRITEH